MANIVKKVIAPVKAVAKAPIQKAVAKATVKPEYEILSMDNIELVAKGGGGGKTLSAFSTNAFSLGHGQGFKISDEKYGEKGKGMASTYAGAARRGIKLRVRRDVNGQLWLFRVSEVEENEAAERKAARLAEETA